MRRTRRILVGDVFAVPLRDGTFGLGHVVHYYHEPSCALFSVRATSPKGLLTSLGSALKDPLTILVLTGEEIERGRWPVIANVLPAKSGLVIPVFMDKRNPSYTASCGVGFLEAYHGLIPWDEASATPDFYERMLLPGVSVPATVRYRPDVDAMQCIDGAASAELQRRTCVTDGPAAIHVQIIYPGTDLPTLEQLRTRHILEERLAADGAGRIASAGGGGGIMDVYLETDDVKRSLPIVERIVAELGLAADTLIETEPLELEDDEEEDSEAS